VDGWLESWSVQIKYDQTASPQGNVYHELYEKTRGQNDQPWRASAHAADAYIFTSESFALLIPVWLLAEMEIGLKLSQIRPTSIGLLIPFARFVGRDGVEIKYARAFPVGTAAIEQEGRDG